MNSKVLRRIRGCFAFLLSVFFFLPDPRLILIQMPMSGVTHWPHCAGDLRHSPSHKNSTDYFFHNNSEGTSS